MITHHEPAPAMEYKPLLDMPALPNGIGMIFSMNRLGKHVYGATVTHAEKTRRRAANKRARAARRAGRN